MTTSFQVHFSHLALAMRKKRICFRIWFSLTVIYIFIELPLFATLVGGIRRCAIAGIVTCVVNCIDDFNGRNIVNGIDDAIAIYTTSTSASGICMVFTWDRCNDWCAGKMIFRFLDVGFFSKLQNLFAK